MITKFFYDGKEVYIQRLQGCILLCQHRKYRGVMCYGYKKGGRFCLTLGNCMSCIYVKIEYRIYV